MDDPYPLLNYVLIDTRWEMMQAINWIYQPFNLVEGVIWLGYIPRTIWKYGTRDNRGVIAGQCTSFLLFALSDFIEVGSTTVLLLLFKLAVLIALLLGHQAIRRARPDS